MRSGLAFIGIALGVIALNLAILGAAVWLVVKVLQWTGVL